MTKEKTLILIKPDGVKRNLIGKIITRFEDAGLKVIGMKMVWSDDKLAKRHYTEDIAKRHGERVRTMQVKYLQEGPVIAMVLEGVEAVTVTRKIIGSTYPNESPPGTIRGDFAHVSKEYANPRNLNVRNLVHASGNASEAKEEIDLWFKPNELHSYKTVHDMISFDERD